MVSAEAGPPHRQPVMLMGSIIHRFVRLPGFNVNASVLEPWFWGSCLDSISTRWVFYASTAALLWSTIGVAYKLALLRGAHSEWLIVGRPVLGGLAALIVILLRRDKPGKWAIIIGFVSLGPLFILYLKAVEYIGAGLAAILLYTAPIWVIVLSPLLSEHVSPLGVLAAITGFLGVVLISLPAMKLGEIIGLLMGLGSGVAYASYMLFARQASRGGVSTVETGLYSQLFAAVEVSLIMHPSVEPNVYDLAGVLYLGVFTMIIPYMLHVRALSLVKAYRVAIISLLEPIGATILAYILLGETLSLLQILGTIMVLLSAALVSLKP